MQRTTALAAAAALALLSNSAPAVAQPTAPEPAGAARPIPDLGPPQGPGAQLTASATWTERYGWHILFADLAVFGATLAISTSGIDDSDDLSSAVFMGGYVGGAPLVHLAHDNPRGALYSFGLRLTAPMAGAAVGVALDDCREDEWLCPLGGMVLGGAVGMVGASVIDAVFLAKQEVSAPGAHLLRVGSVTADPFVSATGDRAFVGLAGSF